MTRLALLLVACGMVAAGCVGPTPDDDEPLDPASGSAIEGRTDVADATQDLPRAMELAQAWDASATLGAVLATEGVHAQPEDPPYLYDTRADPAVGDGLALVWSYLFYAAEREAAYVVSLGADGATLYAHEQSNPLPFSHERTALATPILSSERAAALVNENETSARFVAEHPTSFVRLALAATPEGASWIYHRATSSGFGLYAMVDATSGTLKEIADGPRFIVDPPHPCSSDGACGPYQPEPPATPPPEEVRKDATLDAFNREASIELAPRAWEFAYDLVVTAEGPGDTPLDERTLTLYGPDGAMLQQTSGVGRLEIALEDEQPIAYGPLRATIFAKTPPAQEQTVALSMLLTYTEHVGYGMRAYTSGGGYVGFRQVSDAALDIPPDANVTLRIAIMPNGPASAPSDAEPTTWELLDPQGKSVGSGAMPGGDLAFRSASGGVYTLRVTGGLDAMLGGMSYSYAMAATGSHEMWM